ncbi:Histone deacetylase [Sarcoptes scabiei]|nr:Histone deacetylase [Sarcoptes scabiei]
MSASGNITWKALSMSTVIYPSEDIYGKFLAIVSLLPIAIIIAFFTLAIFIRDIHVILFFIGQLSNEISNVFLKNYFQEDRPRFDWRDDLTNFSYGWPSGHSQFMAFFVVYSTLCLIFKLSMPFWFRYSLISINLIAFALVIHSRIYLLYHFANQCFCGVLIGSVSASLWFILVFKFLEPLFHNYLIKSDFGRKIGFCSIYLKISNENKNKIKRKA